MVQYQKLGKGAIFSRANTVLMHVLKGDVKGQSGPGKDIQGGFRLTLSDPYKQITTQLLSDRLGIHNIQKDFISSIPISLPYEMIYDNLWVGRQETQGKEGKMVHECQQIPFDIYDATGQMGYAILTKRIFGTGGKSTTMKYYVPPDYTTIELCDCQKCKPHIQFRFFIRRGLENYGVCGFSTHSKYDVSRIPAQLLYYDTVLRQYGFKFGIARIPLLLERVSEHVTLTTEKTGSYKDDKSLVNIRIDDEFLKEFPIFSTPPLCGVPEDQRISAPYLRKDTKALIEDMIIESPKTVIEFVERVLRTGIRFNAETHTVVPVTEHWLRNVLIPKIEKANMTHTPENDNSSDSKESERSPETPDTTAE